MCFFVSGLLNLFKTNLFFTHIYNFFIWLPVILMHTTGTDTVPYPIYSFDLPCHFCFKLKENKDFDWPTYTHLLSLSCYIPVIFNEDTSFKILLNSVWHYSSLITHTIHAWHVSVWQAVFGLVPYSGTLFALTGPVKNTVCTVTCFQLFVGVNMMWSSLWHLLCEHLKAVCH